jgi:cytoplasmic iron level regulating protein YaaA (DUF328/UPF0246 family)
MNAIIVGCSRRKVQRVELSAIEIYQGWCFPWLRARLHQCYLCREQIFIISALHGLLNASDRVDSYDCELTVSRADELRSLVLQAVKERILDSLHPREIVAILEPLYFSLVKQALMSHPTLRVFWFSGVQQLNKIDAILESWILPR